MPPFPCPSCGDRLEARENGFHFDPSKESKFYFDHVDGDPEQICGVFTLRLVCARSVCKEAVSCLGSFKMVQDEYPDEGKPYFHMLSPMFFTPTIHLFGCSPNLPDTIKKPLVSSFSLFWAHPNASGNSLRISVEALMDWRGVKKLGTDRKPIKLHHRIVEFQKKEPDLGSKLLAVKWLGNSGSHLSGLERKDVINGYLLFSYVLEQMFERRLERLTKLAKRINRREGPA